MNNNHYHISKLQTKDAIYQLKLISQIYTNPKKHFIKYILSISQNQLKQLQKQHFPFINIYFTKYHLIISQRIKKQHYQYITKVLYQQKNIKYNNQLYIIQNNTSTIFNQQIFNLNQLTPYIVYKNMILNKSQSFISVNRKQSILKIIQHINWINLKNISILQTNISSLQPFVYLLAPNIQYIDIDIRKIYSFQSFAKTKFQHLKSIKFANITNQINTYPLTRSWLSNYFNGFRFKSIQLQQISTIYMNQFQFLIKLQILTPHYPVSKKNQNNKYQHPKINLVQVNKIINILNQYHQIQ